MGMQIGRGDEDDELNAVINTTPLVDVMLVLLIIFLITIPVVTENIPVKLPAEENQPLQTRPENITIAVDIDGNLFWNNEALVDAEDLQKRLFEIAQRVPQPEIHIRGDQETRYDNVNQIVEACQRAAIFKVGFITEPPPRG
ncbi:MAG: exbD [Panacagrimonas sp.]|jgi:biopolymer transport protein ExbD|nr:biopolymer transporter ExbD [Panacagrimonas sp.]MCC2655969.1 exbD [Panacagrimonas sp.]